MISKCYTAREVEIQRILKSCTQQSTKVCGGMQSLMQPVKAFTFSSHMSSKDLKLIQRAPDIGDETEPFSDSI